MSSDEAKRITREEMMLRQKSEQEMAEACDLLPRFYKSLYDGYLNEGFSEEQAMRLVIAQIQKP